MTTAIKLMNEDMTTRGGYQYAEGMVATADGPGIELCSDGLLHVYESLEQAVMFAPIHGPARNYVRAHEVECDIVARDGCKAGAKSLTVGRRVPLPEITVPQRIAVAIILAWPLGSASWRTWAERWLSGADRTFKAAEEAAWAAARAAAAAVAAAAAAAAAAAEVAAEAAARAAVAAAEEAAEAVEEADFAVKVRAVVRTVLNTPESEWLTLVPIAGDDT